MCGLYPEAFTYFVRLQIDMVQKDLEEIKKQKNVKVAFFRQARITGRVGITKNSYVFLTIVGGMLQQIYVQIDVDILTHFCKESRNSIDSLSFFWYYISSNR